MKVDFNKIINSILVALILALGSLIGKFYHDWITDEAEEEHLMFDNAKQKMETIQYPEQMPAFELRLKMHTDSLFQMEVLEQLKENARRDQYQDSINLLNADQMYQIKELLDIK